ncbi:hypothetical protein LCGC14_3141610, partial [marine sediment metagenome]
VRGAGPISLPDDILSGRFTVAPGAQPNNALYLIEYTEER